jgi:hypothetical protein
MGEVEKVNDENGEIIDENKKKLMKKGVKGKEGKEL